MKENTLTLFEKWIDRIYSEQDFGRSIALSIAGMVGLAVYLMVKDGFVAVFLSVILYPAVRVIADNIYINVKRRKKWKEVNRTYNHLSEAEKQVVKAFVDAGGAVLTWSQVNRLNLSVSAIESLVHRGFLHTSVTADGLTETFVLDSDLFDVAQGKQ